MANLQIFARAENARTFASGTKIVTQGESGDEMFVVLEGTVDVLIGDRVLLSLGPGEILGEMALVEDDHLRHADVVAKSDVKLVPIDRRQFIFLVQNHPNFALEVMKTMAERLDLMNKHLLGPR
jgi:CRP-like cAMP-binding protein